MTRFLALAFAGVFSFQAAAQQVNQGVGLACDTKEQVEQFVESMNGGNTAPDSITQINAKTGSTSCGIVHVAWNEEAVLARVTINNSIYELISFVVIGVQRDNGWVPVRPMLQFGLKRTMDRDV